MDTCTWCWWGDTTRNQPRSCFGSEARLELGGQPLCPQPRLRRPFYSTHGSPTAKQISVTPTAAFNQLLQLVNFTQRPKEQITGRQECRLLQLVQRASGSQASWPGELRSAVGTRHIPGGNLAWRRLPRTRGSPWQRHAAAGSVRRDIGSFSLGKTLDSASKQEAAALKVLLGGRAAIAGSAFLCARGRHEHILTAGFRRGKGHEKFES